MHYMDKGLPDSIAIYFHSLEPADYYAFRELVQFLRSSGYEFCLPDDFLIDDDRKKAFLSFDDNYRSWYEALQLFEELAVSVTFYINTLPLRGKAGRREQLEYFNRICHRGERVPLDADEIRELEADGHVIGSHTHSHFILSSLRLQQAKDEILRGKEELEGILYNEVRHFSYPFGMRRHFNKTLRAYCKAIGFATVASAIPGLQHRAHRHFHINRTLYRLERPLEQNVLNVRIDGRLFEWLTGRSVAE